MAPRPQAFPCRPEFRKVYEGRVAGFPKEEDPSIDPEILIPEKVPLILGNPKLLQPDDPKKWSDRRRGSEAFGGSSLSFPGRCWAGLVFRLRDSFKFGKVAQCRT